MRSLRTRLTITHTLVALVALLIVATLATIVIRRAFDRLANQPDADAEAVADWLADRYQQLGNWSRVAERMARARLDSAVEQRLSRSAPGRIMLRRRVQIFDNQGKLIFDSAFPGARRQLPSIVDGVQSAVIVEGREVGTVLVSGQRDVLDQTENQFLWLVYGSVIGGSALAAVVALAVGLLITRRVTRPLRLLREAAQRLASGAHHEPLATPPDTELRELALAFNTMAFELERQQHLRRQLVADIAHELRTPLSVLRLQIEGLEDGVEQVSPAMLSSLAEEVHLLTHLVEDLRLLSLADAGQITLAIDDVDAEAAVERAVRAAAARARLLGIDLRAESPAEPLAAAADPQRLAQILSNLIENALRYTPAGGQVAVHAHAEQPALVVFEVRDTGPGIPPDELPHIFDRFYRADRARARETGGSGLGLAIVQRLVELHGGRIWVTSAPGRGATFHVALPRVVHEATSAPSYAPAPAARQPQPPSGAR